MQDQELEQHFSYIGEELTSLREDVNLLKEDVSNLKSSFARQEGLLKMVFDIVKVYDIERKEIKSTLWEHDRRLIHLENA